MVFGLIFTSSTYMEVGTGQYEIKMKCTQKIIPLLQAEFDSNRIKGLLKMFTEKCK